MYFKGHCGKTGDKVNQNPRTCLPSLCCEIMVTGTLGTSAKIGNVIMAVNYRILIGTDILDNVSGTVDQPSLPEFWSKYVSPPISISPLLC